LGFFRKGKCESRESWRFFGFFLEKVSGAGRAVEFFLENFLKKVSGAGRAVELGMLIHTYRSPKRGGRGSQA